MKAILYARYSPRPRDSDSIESQVEDMTDWCNKHGHEIGGVYSDPDTSGTVSLWQRPGLSDAITSLRSNYLFVVRNLNRAARSIGVAITIEEELDRIGAVLVSLEQGGVQDSKCSNPTSWFTRMICYAVSELERIQINDRTSRRMLQHQENGRAMGSQAPYGWKIVDGQLEKHEREQFTIEHVRKYSNEGYSAGEIVAMLEVEPQHCPRGKRWHKQTVRRILKRHGEQR